MLRAPTDDVPEFEPELEAKFRKQIARQERLNKSYLYNADPSCQHHVVVEWSGYRCTKCRGWYCA